MDDLALAMAAEFRTVDVPAAIATLDALAENLARAVSMSGACPQELTVICGQVLGSELGFAGDRDRYDDPENSMLDVVLSRRRGLPILLSVVYTEVARRAGIPWRALVCPGTSLSAISVRTLRC
jgi:regulator of sirC expression with transglutaminase-like and TPR domain